MAHGSNNDSTGSDDVGRRSVRHHDNEQCVPSGDRNLISAAANEQSTVLGIVPRLRAAWAPAGAFRVLFDGTDSREQRGF